MPTTIILCVSFFSPLYWLYRFRLRSLIRKAVKCSAANYCISPLQKKEYEKAFGVSCKLLQKFVDFSKIPPKKELSKPIKIVYTGNLATGRWKTLALIAESLKRINENGVKAVLYIYSATVLAPKSEKRLDDGKNSFFLALFRRKRWIECRTKPTSCSMPNPLAAATGLLFGSPFQLKSWTILSADGVCWL